MVETTQGAGSLSIKGTLDIRNIKQGFVRMVQAFNSVKGVAKSFTSDLTRMTIASRGLVRWLRRIGVVGATAIVGLASKSPAVAPALAKLGVVMGKLQRSLGEALAPAFEKVVGWLNKLASWVGTNKGSISEIAGETLNWAEKVGEFLLPALKKVGQWASEHPKFFSALLVGLAIGPTVIGGIKAVGGLVSALAAGAVSASLLTALAYIAAIGGASFAGFKAATALVNKAREIAGIGTDPNALTDGSGQTLVNRLGQKGLAKAAEKYGGSGLAPFEDPLKPFSPAHDKAIANIQADGLHRTLEGSISARREEDRRFFLLQWWDAVWG